MTLKEQAKIKVQTLESMRKREGKSISAFAKEIGVEKQTYWNWVNKDIVPNLESMDKINEFLEG